MPTQLYLCSSKRHLYLALGLAQQAAAECHLVIIDQDPACDDPLLEAVKVRPGPFASVVIWNRPADGAQRRHLFARIADLVGSLRPAEIHVGNDRRIEFQYAMYCARAFGTTGVYIDDGTGTYVNGTYLKFGRSWIDLSIVAFLKKLQYGWWYQRRRYLGGTDWVDRCQVQFPQLMPAAVRCGKPVSGLDPAPFRSPPFNALLDVYLRALAAELDFSAQFDAVVMLPHSKHVRRYYRGVPVYLEMLQAHLRGLAKLALKYHPRETNFYFPAGPQQLVLPAHLPAEMLVGRLQTQMIVGDTSSALLSAIWLHPQARVISVCARGDANLPLVRLLASAGGELVLC